jgi:hypothetical protein
MHVTLPKLVDRIVVQKHSQGERANDGARWSPSFPLPDLDEEAELRCSKGPCNSETEPTVPEVIAVAIAKRGAQ